MERRVVALIDMDAFYVQTSDTTSSLDTRSVEVEMRDAPELLGKPVAVVQYNQVKRGGLIAVSYEARAEGVKRNMRADEALRHCPTLNLVSVPVSRHKSDLTKYRKASAEVFAVLNSFDPLITVEKASIDEAYLDLTKMVKQRMENLDLEDEVGESARYPATFVLSTNVTAEENERETRLQQWLQVCSQEEEDLKLALGAGIIESVRAEILRATRFHCSAGIGQCKTTAKLICSRHKPRQQTVLCPDFIPSLFDETPVPKDLVGRYGETLGILRGLSLAELSKDLGSKTGSWLCRLLQEGDDGEEVTARDLCKSIGSSKNFPGSQAITTVDSLRKWTRELAADLHHRLSEDRKENKRTARGLTVHFRCLDQLTGKWERPTSKAFQLSAYSEDLVANTAFNCIKAILADGDALRKPVIHMGMNAGKFSEGEESGSHSILGFVKPPEGVDENATLALPCASSSVESMTENSRDSFEAGPSKMARLEDSESEGDQPSTSGAINVEEDPETTLLAAEIERAAPQEPRRQEVGETGWVSSGDFCPTDVSQIDDDTWAQLPPQLQFEIRSLCRQSHPARKTVKAPAKRPPKKADKSAKIPITAFFDKDK